MSFRGRHLLAAKLRSSSVDAADGSVAEVARIVGQIRERWPATSIVIRADSGFCRDDLMIWCESNGVQYVLGLAGNSRLKARLAPEMRTAKRTSKRTGQPAREFADFAYRTRRSWSCKTTGDRQGGVDERRGQSALHRDECASRLRGCALPLRDRLLPARRDGKPAQGMPGRTVRRPHAGADPTRQPASPVAVIVRLHPDVRRAPHRARRHQARACDLRHDPSSLGSATLATSAVASAGPTPGIGYTV